MDSGQPTYEELQNRVLQLEEELRRRDLADHAAGWAAEKALRESEGLLALFLKNSPIYAFIKEVTPTESKVVIASENFIDMIGVPGSKMVGKTMRELFPPEFADKISSDDWAVVANGKDLIIDEDLNGRHYTSIKYPITMGGRNLLAGYTIDLTDLKRAEAEIRHKNEELLKVVAEKDLFFSIIAHDLRSPFNALLGFTQMMVEDLDSLNKEEIKKFTLIMRDSAYHIYRLVENLLDWSRIQRGLMSINPEQFLLMPKVSEYLVSALESSKKKGIEIRFDIPSNLVLNADANMIGSIIRNLTSNAVKFTPSGGSIILSAKPVNGNQVEVSVSDNGIGMSKSHIGKLFMLDEHTTRRGTEGEPSTGLGLIICRDFVEKHGGTIWVESEVGKGSTFHFTIPGFLK